jgi:hypothetical protein
MPPFADASGARRAERPVGAGFKPGGAGDTGSMDLATLARAQTVNRAALGVALIALPGVFGRVWSGRAATDDRAKVLARAVGARDLAIAAGGLLALREGDQGWARRSFVAQAAADAVDLLAIAAAGRALPLASRALGGAMAAGSAAVAAAYARRLTA